MLPRHSPPVTRRSSLTLGTRGSALARWQADWVRTQLQAAWPDLDCQTKLFTTSGDRLLDRPLPEISGKGVFTEELEDALQVGEIDLAVHSLKDLPADEAPSLILGAICARDDARDVLVCRPDSGGLEGDHWTLITLPEGARVGTSSLRRSAQLRTARPDLTLLPLRGNVDTRIRKVSQGEYDAIVLAAAGVLRLGLGAHISEYLPFEVMLPAPGQGALAVQCCAGDPAALELLAAIDDAPTRAAVTAERAFLKALGGGCSAPIAAYATPTPGPRSRAVGQFPDRGGEIHLTGLIASPDGRRVIRVSGEGSDPEGLAVALAQQALTEGAEALLR